MNHRIALIGAALIAVAALTPAEAKVTAEEAARLKSGELTPMGAERAGNADGTIPEWTGGLTEVPAGYRSGDPRPDPFAGEKPLFSIDASNVDQYADRLTEATKALLKKYPDYRLDVYPTHRTFAAPQWVYDNTFANATRATTTGGGYGLEGAYGGAPFPIPKDGYEVMWNHLVRWRGVGWYTRFRAMVVSRGSEPVVSSDSRFWEQFPYYYPDGSLETFNGFGVYVMVVTDGPPFKAGEAFLIKDPVNLATDERKAWQYLLGQRRVRRAPRIAYDTPDFVTSGIENFDEAETFNGSMDRYTVKLIGKREMYVPYNNNRLNLAPYEDVLGKRWVKPKYMRWELHRVWVVELNLREGKRHVMPRRRLYIDEDSWHALLADNWDANGDIWRLSFTLSSVAPDMPGFLSVPFGSVDLQAEAYTVATLLNGLTPQVEVATEPRPESFFTPQNLARLVVR